MAEYVESIRYTADIDDLRRKLDDIRDQTGRVQSDHDHRVGLMSRAWDGFRGGLSTTIGMLGRIGTVVGTAFAALGGYGLNAAADFQQTRIAFEGIFGSAQQADEYLDQLRAFSASTPFEFPELASTAQRLLGVGFAAADVIPVLTDVGNTASALGVGAEGIQGVVNALGQIQGKGKVSAEELQQISEAIPGFSAIGAIAEHFGITTAEAFEKVSAGAVSADEGIQAILEGMQNFPGAAGAMDRQSRTLNGVISTLKDTFRNALIDGIEPFLPAISDGLVRAAPLIEQGIGGAVRVLQGLGGWIADNWPQIKATILTVAQAVHDWFVANWPTIRAVAQAAIAGLVTAFQHVAEVVGEVWPEVRDIIQTVVDIITEVWARWGDDIQQVVDRVWPAIKAVIEATIGTIRAIITTVLALINGDWDRAWQTIKDAAAQVWEAIKAVVGLAVEAIRVALVIAWDLIKQNAADAWGALKEGAARAWEEIKAGVKAGADAVVAEITNLPNRFGDAIAALYRVMRRLGEQMLEGLKSALSSTAGFAGDVGRAVVNSVAGVINSQIIDRINSALEFTIPLRFAPDIHIDPPDIPRIPTLAQGGVVDDATLAMIGEGSDPEAVIPLSERVLRTIGEGIAAATRGGVRPGDAEAGGVTVVIVRSLDEAATYVPQRARSAVFLAGRTA